MVRVSKPLTLLRAIDRFCDWRQLERDSTPESVRTYWRILVRIADDWPDARLSDFDGRQGTEMLRESIARHWARRSAATRANVISVVRSFFDWAVAEDRIESNPARRIARPPTRKPDVYRPTADELERVRAAAHTWERPAIVMMEGVGLRASEVCRLRWRDVDLTAGRVRVLRKGSNRQTLPLLPDVLDALRTCHREIQPDPDWHVFIVKQKRWVAATHRIETVRDPMRPAGRQSLGNLVVRVCRRAGTPRLAPHQLRHGFATRLRARNVPVDVIQRLLGHSRLDTTERYLNEHDVADLERALERALRHDEAEIHLRRGSPERPQDEETERGK